MIAYNREEGTLVLTDDEDPERVQIVDLSAKTETQQQAAITAFFAD